jgi:hypothetical protein
MRRSPRTVSYVIKIQDHTTYRLVTLLALQTKFDGVPTEVLLQLYCGSAL